MPFFFSILARLIVLFAMKTFKGLLSIILLAFLLFSCKKEENIPFESTWKSVWDAKIIVIAEPYTARRIIEDHLKNKEKVTQTILSFGKENRFRERRNVSQEGEVTYSGTYDRKEKIAVYENEQGPYRNASFTWKSEEQYVITVQIEAAQYYNDPVLLEEIGITDPQDVVVERVIIRRTYIPIGFE